MAWRVSALILALMAAAFSSATAGEVSARDFSHYQPSFHATRIDTTEAPTIDGDLSDAVWSKAAPITEFYQLEPTEGAPASERTEVRVLYDEIGRAHV